MARHRVLTVSAVIAVLAACSDDNGGPSAQVKKFCNDLFASSAFSCCSAEDRADPAFVVRSGYSSPAQCADALTRLSGVGNRAFDAAAADGCIAYLGSRACNAAVTLQVKAAAAAAGCNRVMAGTQDEGQPCTDSEDCKPGLVCPSVKETGASTCAKPAASNQTCVGGGTVSVDHPGCLPGLVCSQVGDLPSCITPPCPDFRCVPLSEEGEPCTGIECAANLFCKAGICSKGGPAGAGVGCTISDQCAEGLYCDRTTATCAARKSAGAACTDATNLSFECSGACKDGACVAFCSSP